LFFLLFFNKFKIIIDHSWFPERSPSRSSCPTEQSLQGMRRCPVGDRLAARGRNGDFLFFMK